MTEGLSDEQVTRRQKEYGRNAPSPPKSHTFQKFFGYFFKGFGPVLLVGAILVFIAWKPLGQPPALANLVSNALPSRYGNLEGKALMFLSQGLGHCLGCRILHPGRF